MVLKALVTACIIGTLLLIINQYDAIFGAAELRVIPAILTYCVPLFVFILGQKSARKN